MSWVSKFNNFLLPCSETEARFIFEGFNIVLYGKFVSDSPALFLLFFYLVCILFEGLFQPLCQSVLVESVLVDMYSNVSDNLYLRPCSIAIYGKSCLYCLYHLRLFFWSVNCENLVCKLCITFCKCQDTKILFILECI